METFFEYVVKPPEKYKKIKRRKICLIAFYLSFFLILTVGVLLTPIINRLFLPIFVIALIVCFVIYYFTWPKTRPEYDYSVELGDLRLSVIYGGRMRRVVLRTALRDAELIAPNNGMYENKIKDFAPEKEYFGAFTDEQRNYFMLFKDDNDINSILYFSADVDQIKQFKKFNGRTVVDRTAKTTENA